MGVQDNPVFDLFLTSVIRRRMRRPRRAPRTSPRRQWQRATTKTHRPLLAD